MARLLAPIAALFTGLLLAVPAMAQDAVARARLAGDPWADSVMLQTQMRFELESPDGVGVSEQQWNRFIAEDILPRFPETVTIIDATGPKATGTATLRLVSILHPNTPDALGRIAEIATAFKTRFGGAKVTRFDIPVRVGN